MLSGEIGGTFFKNARGSIKLNNSHNDGVSPNSVSTLPVSSDNDDLEFSAVEDIYQATQSLESDIDQISQQDAKLKKMTAAFQMILECVEGEDVSRKGIQGTPLRAAKAMQFLTQGYSTTAKEVVGNGIFPDGYENDVVLVKDIDIHSLCEHHMLPFSGKVHISYIVGASGQVLGLSKLARIANMYARRLQVQERLTRQIANEIMYCTGAHGVAVMIESSHMCMVMRGVEKSGSLTSSTCYLGHFDSKENEGAADLRREFLSMVRK